jgi:hypothetical protein
MTQRFDLLVLGTPGRDPALLLFGVAVSARKLRAEMWLVKNPVNRGKRLWAVEYADPALPRHPLGLCVKAPRRFEAVRVKGGEAVWTGLQQQPLELLLEAE